MKKLKIGDVCKVSEYSGLDSRRIGKIVKYNYSTYWNIPGVYKPFDSKREFMLQDINNGEFFTMFKNRLSLI